MFHIKTTKIENGCDCWGRSEYDNAYEVYYNDEFLCRMSSDPTVLIDKINNTEKTKAKWFTQLKEYQNFEKLGRVVPKEAYYLSSNLKIYKCEVMEVAYYSIYRTPSFTLFYEDENTIFNFKGRLGNTVFLTENEAELKLNELKKIKKNETHVKKM